MASGEAEAHRRRLEEWRNAEPPLVPFHWQIEFPEVFERDPPGFDAIVGNPPFAGKNSVAAANAPGYTDWLKQLHEESHGNADLVAHGETGLIVPPDSPAAIAETMVRLASAPDQARAMGRAGRARAEARFSLAAMVGTYQGVYDQALRRAQPQHQGG